MTYFQQRSREQNEASSQAAKTSDDLNRLDYALEQANDEIARMREDQSKWLFICLHKNLSLLLLYCTV